MSPQKSSAEMGTCTVSSVVNRDMSSAYRPKMIECLPHAMGQTAGCRGSSVGFRLLINLKEKLLLVSQCLTHLLRMQKICVHHLPLKGRPVSYFLTERLGHWTILRGSPQIYKNFQLSFLN